jgi:hypothetical protein
MWTDVMETDNFSPFSLVNYKLGVAVILPLIVQIPLQRLKRTSISDNVFVSEDFSRFLFRIPATSILDWSKDCCWYVLVAHQLSLLVE